MLRSLIALGALALLSTVAVAQDDEMDAPVYSWSGFYIGGHGGYGFAEQEFSRVVGGSSATIETYPEGFLGGGQIGAQMQWGWFVTGLEASYSAGRLDGGDTDVVLTTVPVPIVGRGESEVSDILTLTARLGVGADRWLFYGEAGYASADVDLSAVNDVGFALGSSGNRDHGWMVGAGIEHAFGNHFILGAEYNFLNLNGSDRSLDVAGVGPTTHAGIETDVHTIVGRAGIKFGGGTPPP